MPSDGRALVDGFARLEAALVRAGWHPTSPEWRRTLEAFWLSGKRRLVVRAGRRAGKSTTIARVVVCSALFGQHRRSKGSVLSFVCVSVKMDEARDRLSNIDKVLDVLGEPHTRTGDAIELTRRAMRIVVMPASHRSAVGFDGADLVEDELARWLSDDGSSNPASEVDASLTPSVVSNPNGRIYSISSPLGLVDFHAKLVADGDCADQAVAVGPTWKWNPTISEGDTRAMQRDDRLWRREYAAEPQASDLAAFDVEGVNRAFLERRASEMGEPIVVCDPSSGRRDRFTFGVVRWARDELGPFLRVTDIGAIEGRFFGSVKLTDIAERIAKLAAEVGAHHVHGDQREALGMKDAIEAKDLSYHAHAWTNATKSDAVASIRSMLSDGDLTIEPHDGMRMELLGFRETITRTGAITYGARGAAHDDYVALLVTALHADISRQLERVGHEGSATGGISAGSYRRFDRPAGHRPSHDVDWHEPDIKRRWHTLLSNR